jgi:hypothetical protein
MSLTRIAAAAVAFTLAAGPITLRAQPSVVEVACRQPTENPGHDYPSLVHPTRLREQFAKDIVAGNWSNAIRGYAGVITTALRDTQALAAPRSAAFRDISSRFEREVTDLSNAAAAAVLAPRAEWAAKLSAAEINRAQPRPDGGQMVVMARADGGQIILPNDGLRQEEAQLLCWSSWSLDRLLGTVNFETVPAAFLRVRQTADRWTRYQEGGPLQLPHELLLNRLVRPVLGGRGASRYDPPRVSLAAVHPFAGVELRRADGGWKNRQGAAVHLAGVSVWLGDFRTNVGASWIAAADGDGTVGQGGMLRVSDLVSIGFIDRRIDGVKRRSSIFQLDALRLISSDANAKRALSAIGISGKMFEQAPKP